MIPEVKPFAQSTQGARDDGSQLDKAGQTILQLLHKAADVAEQNSRHAIDTAESFRTNFALPRIVLCSSRLTWKRSDSGPSAPSNGCTRSILKSLADRFRSMATDLLAKAEDFEDLRALRFRREKLAAA